MSRTQGVLHPWLCAMSMVTSILVADCRSHLLGSGICDAHDAQFFCFASIDVDVVSSGSCGYDELANATPEWWTSCTNLSMIHIAIQSGKSAGRSG